MRRSLGVVAALIALGSWALASPVGSSPDDDYHLGSIWCAHGIEPGRCENGSSADTRAVPEHIDTSVCYQFEPRRSAACQFELLQGRGMVETDRGDWFNRSYPPVYYWFHGLFVTGDVTDSALLMRLVNVLLSVAVIAALYVLAPAGLRPALVGGTLVTAVPLGIFLAASNNPSGWAILSAVTLPVALLGFLTVTERRRRWALAVLATLALVFGAGSRADSAAYAIVAIGVALILTQRRGQGRSALYSLLLPAGLFVAAVLAFLSAGQSASVGASGSPSAQPLTLARLWHTLTEVPTLWPGAFGTWGLGWIDTPMPGLVWVASWSVFIAVLALALTGVSARTGASVALIAAAAFVVPSYLLVAEGIHVGVGVQPRYLLPLLAMLVVTALVRLDGPPFRLSAGQQWALVSALGVAHAVALHANIRRYVTGVDEVSVNLNSRIEWWWQIPVSPMLIWLIGSIAFGIGITLLTRELVAPRPAAARDGVPTVKRVTATGSDKADGVALAART